MSRISNINRKRLRIFFDFLRQVTKSFRHDVTEGMIRCLGDFNFFFESRAPSRHPGKFRDDCTVVLLGEVVKQRADIYCLYFWRHEIGEKLAHVER